MTVEKERLLSLIEFTQAAARLKLKTTNDVTNHKKFCVFEENIIGLAGIRLNIQKDDDEIWLLVERLHATKPPIPKDELLELWLDLPDNPDATPLLKKAILAQTLPDYNEEEKTEEFILLAEFEQKREVEVAFELYIEKYWQLWANEERKRRKTIKLYNELFKILNNSDNSLELVWGMGIALWKTGKAEIKYPLITQLIELSINDKFEIEVRPRNVNFNLEYSIYEMENNLGVATLEKEYKNFKENSQAVFSPFDRISFEPLLELAVKNLDAKAVYYPRITTPDDRKLPKISESLQVTDSFVIFERQRNQAVFIQDLEQFKTKLSDIDIHLIPEPVKELVSEPSETNKEINLENYRGVSLVDSNGYDKKAKDLFFPLPFNEEQVKIIQLLDSFDGVVVQGPPGTGKTHTIANIISHYLAMGQRILVTSMKDPALAVLHDKLPEEIKPLAISLLASEKEGMQQFENSIKTIASEVQNIDKNQLRNSIKQIEDNINILHANLANIDTKISDWTKKHLSTFMIDNQVIYPLEAAEELIKGVGNYEFLPDNISIQDKYKAQFDDQDIIRLRTARRNLGEDIDYINEHLLDTILLPQENEILKTHNDLVDYQRLESALASGKVPYLVNESEDIIKEAALLIKIISELEAVNNIIIEANKSWVSNLKHNIKKAQLAQIIEIFEGLGSEIKEAVRQRNEFLTKPVFAPINIELDADVVKAIENKANDNADFIVLNSLKNNTESFAKLTEELQEAFEQNNKFAAYQISIPESYDDLIPAIINKSNGKSAFGLSVIFGKKDRKSLFSLISINNLKPQTKDEWKIIHEFILHKNKIDNLNIRFKQFIDSLYINELIKEKILDSINDCLLICNFIEQNIEKEKQLLKKLEEIKIITNAPQTTEDWQYVHNYIMLQLKNRELIMRWNNIAVEIGIEKFVEYDANIILKSADSYSLYGKIKEAIALEKTIINKTENILQEIEWGTNSGIINAKKLQELKNILQHHLTKDRLSVALKAKENLQNIVTSFTYSGKIIEQFKDFAFNKLGNNNFATEQIQQEWSRLIKELYRLHGLKSDIVAIQSICRKIADSGGVKWADMLRKEPLTSAVDFLLPDNWQSAWRLKRIADYIASIDCRLEMQKLINQRSKAEKELAKYYKDFVSKNTWLKLTENATPKVKAALQSYLASVKKVGKGTGKGAVYHRENARDAAMQANHAIPCWIMNHHRIAESLPNQFACFDLVIIDEASQSDLTALPALFRAKKILIVGDEKQVSPDTVGLDTNKIRVLQNKYLANHIGIYRAQISPENSIYDLFNTVFASSRIMLQEHFRCINPIIEYSKREFYDNKLKPLRLPLASQRLDPPLIDVIIQDGFIKNEANQAEAKFIIDEITSIISDPKMEKRTIGVVSLFGNKQAPLIEQMLIKELGTEIISKHNIVCGNARTFQGNERDIIFLSMIVAPQEKFGVFSGKTYEQILNVAASRARDRMYLVRSVELENLSDKDIRKSLIRHFGSPFSQDVKKVQDLRELCESPFELEIYDILTSRNYKVTPQVKVGSYRIDMVVEGSNDNRIAIECDGDRYHTSAEQLANDMQRQRILERVGWRFWRCFASTFVMNKEEVIEDLIKTLKEHGIFPVANEAKLNNNIHSEQRRIKVYNELFSQDDFELESEAA